MHWIRRHRRGRPPHPDILTPAEWRVLELVREGQSNADIAARLGITLPTVKTHVSRILAKTGTRDRRELAAWQGRPAEASRRLGRGFALPLAGWSAGAKVAGGVVAAAVFLGAVWVVFEGLGGGNEPPPPTVGAAPLEVWRESFSGAPALAELLDQVIANPTSIVALATRVDAPCSFHGNVSTFCESQGLGVFDAFEALVVTDLLHCEPCGVPPDHVEAVIDALARGAQVAVTEFHAGPARLGVSHASKPATASLHGVWRIDAATGDLISERLALQATHAVSLRFPLVAGSDEDITGVLLFVDPDREAPIAVIELSTDSWDGFSTARYFRGWTNLFDAR